LETVDQVAEQIKTVLMDITLDQVDPMVVAEPQVQVEQQVVHSMETLTDVDQEILPSQDVHLLVVVQMIQVEHGTKAAEVAQATSAVDQVLTVLMVVIGCQLVAVQDTQTQPIAQT
jgi:hypothetical protein